MRFAIRVAVVAVAALMMGSCGTTSSNDDIALVATTSGTAETVAPSLTEAPQPAPQQSAAGFGMNLRGALEQGEAQLLSARYPIGAGDGHGLACRCVGSRLRELAARAEPPAAAEQHAHADADRIALRYADDPLLARAYGAGARARDARIGELGATTPGLVQCLEQEVAHRRVHGGRRGRARQRREARGGSLDRIQRGAGGDERGGPGRIPEELPAVHTHW